MTKVVANAVLMIALTGLPTFAQEGQSPGQSGTGQNSQDVPHQQPGTNNPDVGKQREPSPKAPESSPQQPADVPHQKPGTNNPDVAKQRRPTPKKGKQSKSTSSSTQP